MILFLLSCCARSGLERFKLSFTFVFCAVVNYIQYRAKPRFTAKFGGK